jgi:ATP-dependent helicase HrpA
VRDRAEYDALLAAVGRDLEAAVREVVALVIRVLDGWRAADRLLGGRADLTMLPALTDMKAQLGRLVHDGFVADTGPGQLARYPTYLRALTDRRTRLDEGAAAVGRDRQLMDRIADLQEALLHRLDALPAGRPPGERLRKVRWMLEEYRVSLWAQQLGTPYPVSDQRIRKALES